MLKLSALLASCFCLLAAGASPAMAANSTVPGTLVTDPPTIMALGFSWEISGDDNRNCVVQLDYRQSGSSAWIRGMDLFRVENRPLRLGGEGSNPPAVSLGNRLAGSIIDLAADTSYEVRLTLNDPDGGAEVRTVTARTRKVPVASNTGRTVNVASSAALTSALTSAQPGDKIVLAPGTYTGSFRPTIDGTLAAPIAIQGQSKTGVIFDGSGNTNWIFDLSSRRYIILENFSIIHAKQTIRGTSSTGIALKNLVLRNLPVSAGNADKTLGPKFDRSTDAYICDNEFFGPQPDQVRDPAFYGPSYNVEIGGSGNVVCHNYMEHWWDAITSADDCYASFYCVSNDFYNNLIMYSTDDAIELDGSYRNVRAFRNRMGSNYNGISTQPIYGGPVYIVRNEIFSNQKSTFKFNTLGGQDGGSGALVYNNTLVNNTQTIYDGFWSNFVFRNNILYSATSYQLWTYVNDVERHGLDFDYDIFRSGVSSPFAKIRWSNSAGLYLSYASRADFCSLAGQECHGALFTSRTSEWVNAPEPQTQAQILASPYGPTAWDFTLNAGAASENSAVLIPNINDHFSGAGPDRGALERGLPLPVYGPRSNGDATPPAAPAGLGVN